MDILGRARKLEFRITRTVDRTAQRFLKSGRREPLEVVHAIVDAIEEEIQAAGRGARVFPFNRIKVWVVAGTSGDRARFEAVMKGEPSLQNRILERLASAGCWAPDLIVKIAYVPHARPDWPTAGFCLEFDRAATAMPPVPQPQAPFRIKLTIVAGAAEQPEYSFTASRIDLGRCAEVRDRRNRLLRVNQVAFTDSEAPLNQSVSRCHAHILSGGEMRECRVYDDHSKQGTGVLRNGKTIVVPPGSLGVRLQSGDEIVLGEARVRFTQRTISPSER